MNALFCRFVLAGLLCCLGVSCTTAYDAYGYPQQVVDPAAAVVGAAAVGLLAYGLASSNNYHDNYRPHQNYYRHNHYYPNSYRRNSYSHYRSYGYYGGFGGGCYY